MKLLLENWKNYILLENIETASRLSIFDFDETIAYSKTLVGVINKETGERFWVSSQEELDKLTDEGGYHFNFSTLDYVYDAVENSKITSILRQRLTDPNTQVMVLTARAMRSIDDIQRVLQMFDEPIETENIIMIGSEGGNKGEYLRDVVLTKYPNIKEIEFYDDSDRNVEHMNQIKNELAVDGNIEKFDIYKVTHGAPKLVI